MNKPLRVAWFPQVPCKAFHVAVESVEQAVLIMDTLADYDLFQFDHNIKPDYSNAGILQQLDDDGWFDWMDGGTGIDDPREYIEWTKEQP